MSTYHRRGHYRRGPNGQRVWVTGHSVTGSGRSRQVYRSPKNVAPRVPHVAPAISMPRSVRWAEPNAACPVCGAAVYFYANEWGSRVYFDEIGPPWPKHPCIVPSADESRYSRVAPVPYELSAGRRILSKAHSADKKNRIQGSGDNATHLSTDAFSVRSSYSVEKGTALHLQRLYAPSAPEVWESPEDISPEAGQLVFVEGRSLSYLDVNRVRLVECPVNLNPEWHPTTPVSSQPSSTGCGVALLGVAIAILLWLLATLWNPINHSPEGIRTGTYLFLIAACILALGIYLISRSRRKRRGGSRSGRTE